MGTVTERFVMKKNHVLSGIQETVEVTRTEIKKYVSFAYAREIFAGIAVVCVGIMCWYGFSWYKVRQNQRAHIGLSFCIEAYHKAQLEEGADFSSAIQLFRDGYAIHGSSSLAPFFLVYEADILLQQGNRHDAIPVLKKAVETLGNSPLAYLYKTKHALVMMDSNETDIKQQGLDALLALAREPKNQYSDNALYFLGRYYAVNNQRDEARMIWQELAEIYEVNGADASPWAERAWEALRLMV